MSFDSKVIKDPIHGFIEFKGEDEMNIMKILSDPFFQRLRRVKQLGFSDYVFPSASHSRFSHSLGVYSVAKRMLSVVEPEGEEKGWSEKGKACLVAALLHDVGHGIFSHSFENAISFYFEKNPKKSEELKELKDAVDHEKVSCRIIKESSISNILIEIGGSGFPEVVEGLILKKNKKCIYTSIVSSELDADRLDYAKRDAYFSGVSSGGIDLGWLIRNLRKGSNDDGEFLYFDSKAYISIEQFTVSLFQLYPTVYLHKRTRGIEYMFSLLMCRVFELIGEGRYLEAGLNKKHPFVVFFDNPNDINNLLLLDDSTFWGSLYLFKDCDDDLIKGISKRIYERNIYPFVDIWKLVEKSSVLDIHKYNLTAFDRLYKLHNICDYIYSELKESELWSADCYYDTYGRPIYKHKEVHGGDAQQINIKVGNDILDIYSISPIVASAASFNIHRVYYDDSVSGKGEEISEKVNSLIPAAVDFIFEN